MTNDREPINHKTQLGKNPSSPGNSINVEQAAAPEMAGFSRLESHKSKEAGIAPLTEEMGEEEGKQAQSRQREKKEDKKCVPLSSFLSCVST
jgi:hypothetical protein